ncbi:VPLPA-CTERM sorting domain-containing protein [Parvularcula sp. LCG005]|uniref:VPLPA-CTERM sorting domain-containing protein n=1 Tax=Parvularcula sp. LCG005 TaxID=3078805 RepID=UPI002941CD12|nr:VPLPA-CTERM sorting domain-containing protein [Parvularcula sp. LCG005]WOI53827.1 VPLPA-CTERM sorting domain-containing protein [Parvularcula sp. LCG005]
MQRAFFCALVLGITFLTAQASAAPMRWYLNNFVYDDGGTAFGYFDYDILANKFTTVNVTTTAGRVFNGATYSYAVPIYTVPNQLYFVTSASGDLTGTPVFASILEADMAFSGDAVSVELLYLFYEGICQSPSCGSDFTIQRQLVSGYISTNPVPLPAALPLFLIGLATVLSTARRRRT